MKLVSLEIHNIRGIRDLKLEVNERNAVVWGPNGSGKSAVVDAVDFLLTGRIRRLTGKGTGALSLSKHGPHIDCPPEDCYVKAIVRLPGATTPIELFRSLASPTKLECLDPKAPQLQSVLTLAARGQHILTRREILNYIAAEGGERAVQIQELLSISEIEETRKSLVKVVNDAEKELQAAKTPVDKAKGAIASTIQKPLFSRDDLASAINELRGVFGAGPIVVGNQIVDIKTGIQLPVVAASRQKLNVSTYSLDATNVRAFYTGVIWPEIVANHSEMRESAKALLSSADLLRKANQRQLITTGLALISENGECPLCDTPWETDSLRDYLTTKLASVEAANGLLSRLTSAERKISHLLQPLLSSLAHIESVSRLLGLDADAASLQTIRTEIDLYLSRNSVAVRELTDPGPVEFIAGALDGSSPVIALVDRIQLVIDADYPDTTPEQLAWDTLTRLEENLKSLAAAEDGLRDATVTCERAIHLREHFIQARDRVLRNLYESVRVKFENLYKELHGEDEKSFVATLEPEGAALNLEVGFYGRGQHPPHALHSEGHQDSMGLCLYLALADKLTHGFLDLIILDDVVMSVDIDHRRQLCSVLTQFFPDRQFLITTHDKAWATLLKTAGVVKARESIEFFNWNIDTGPSTHAGSSMWSAIEADLSRGHVSEAASKLRRGFEVSAKASSVTLLSLR